MRNADAPVPWWPCYLTPLAAAEVSRAEREAAAEAEQAEAEPEIELEAGT